jgi:hypothetical protein
MCEGKFIRVVPNQGFAPVWRCAIGAGIKKADVVEHPEAFNHVGLLVNEPLGTAELLFT